MARRHLTGQWLPPLTCWGASPSTRSGLLALNPGMGLPPLAAPAQRAPPSVLPPLKAELPMVWQDHVVQLPAVLQKNVFDCQCAYDKVNRRCSWCTCNIVNYIALFVPALVVPLLQVLPVLLGPWQKGRFMHRFKVTVFLVYTPDMTVIVEQPEDS